MVGGLLVSLVGWQALFLINVPLSLAALLVVWKFAPVDEDRERGSAAELLRDSDIPGILGFVGSLMLIMMALLNVLPDVRWWLLAGGTVLAALFVWRELRFSPPFLDLRLLGRNRPLLLVYLGFAVFNGIYYFAFFGLPQLLQEAAGYDPGVVGLLMLPLAAMSVIATPFAVRAIERFGVRRVLIAGVLFLVAAAGTMWLLTASFAIPLVLAAHRADGHSVERGEHRLQPGHVRLHPAAGTRGGRGHLPDLPLPRRHHGHGDDRHLLRERREPGQLGPDGDRHAGAGRRRVRRDAAVAGAEMSCPKRGGTPKGCAACGADKPVPTAS